MNERTKDQIDYWVKRMEQGVTDEYFLELNNGDKEFLELIKRKAGKYGHVVLKTYDVEEDGISFEVSRIRCGCCDGVIDFYYIKDAMVPTLAKRVVVKEVE